MPSPTQAVCSPFLPLAHLPFSTRQATGVSRHLQTPRDRRVPPLPPGPDSPGWDLRTQPCSQGGRRLPPPGAGRTARGWLCAPRMQGPLMQEARLRGHVEAELAVESGTGSPRTELGLWD